ncbi:hypothetical protein CEXT_772571 [Caerostris extrusa]|uniref:Uncharacterized protein n=1 Tax=Caerostris extrusa TaxID=172846 RepID=A0AAV4NSX1_CAEEX|nr:hypothetical protein CEXT_772571 [Caerostris extrusa]
MTQSARRSLFCETEAGGGHSRVAANTMGNRLNKKRETVASQQCLNSVWASFWSNTKCQFDCFIGYGLVETKSWMRLGKKGTDFKTVPKELHNEGLNIFSK